MADEITVRRAVEDDIKALAALEKECFSENWSEKGIADSMELVYTEFVVAVFEERVVGYISVYCSVDEGEIMNVTVTESMRRKGVAVKMFDMLFDILKERGIQKVFLDVRVSNEPAMSLYEKLGFERVGKRPAFYRKPREDAYIYRLDIRRN